MPQPDNLTDEAVLDIGLRLGLYLEDFTHKIEYLAANGVEDAAENGEVAIKANRSAILHVLELLGEKDPRFVTPRYSWQSMGSLMKYKWGTKSGDCGL